MNLLPRHLQQLFKKKHQKGKHRLQVVASTVELVRRSVQGQRDEPSPEFEIFPSDPAVRQAWFSLTIREREVIALVCMGHRNYEVAELLGIEYATVQTHLQNIFRKFGLRSRKEIRSALQSWPAEEWWRLHHA